MSEIQDNEILADCAWFADKHRGKNKQSGPHWSTIIRFTPLFDEAVRLQQRVDTLEAYISDFIPVSMEIAKKETIISKLEEKVNVASDLFRSISLWFYKNVGNPDPFWACQFESACKLFENSEEDNNRGEEHSPEQKQGGFVAYTPDYKNAVIETTYGEIIHVPIERIRFLHPQEEE